MHRYGRDRSVNHRIDTGERLLPWTAGAAAPDPQAVKLPASLPIVAETWRGMNRPPGLLLLGPLERLGGDTANMLGYAATGVIGLGVLGFARNLDAPEAADDAASAAMPDNGTSPGIARA